MNVLKLAPDEAFEPVWDFVGMGVCDFRPHWNGDLVNLFTVVYPEHARDATEARFKEIAFQIALWVLEHRGVFSPDDRFQIVVGWPLDVRAAGRQVIKTGGAFDEVQRLVDDRNLISLRSGWDTAIFD